MARKLMIPKTTWMGTDALSHAERDICALGRKALIVAGQSMIRQGYMKMLTDLLERSHRDWEICSGISGEPTDQMIEGGTKKYHEKQCDFIIGFGGGSPLDSAKAIGILSVTEEKITSLVGKEINCCTPPVVAIPSTAGTGS